MNHAYSLLTVKSADNGPDGMTIEGVASTPQTDRVGDIVEPMGAKFAVPMPLLMNHDSKQVVGRVEFAKATANGIPFRAFLPFVKEPGRLKDRIDEAIHTLRYGLVGAVSIGFNALEGGVELDENRRASGSSPGNGWNCHWFRFPQIPRQRSQALNRSMPHWRVPLQAPQHCPQVVRLHPSANLSPPTHSGTKPMSTETIRRMESERVAKMAAAKSIMDKALADGRTPDADEQSSYDSLLNEVKGVDATLDRLRNSRSWTKRRRLSSRRRRPPRPRMCRRSRTSAAISTTSRACCWRG